MRGLARISWAQDRSPLVKRTFQVAAGKNAYVKEFPLRAISSLVYARCHRDTGSCQASLRIGLGVISRALHIQVAPY